MTIEENVFHSLSNATGKKKEAFQRIIFRGGWTNEELLQLLNSKEEIIDTPLWNVLSE